jgi:hypothetical protein
MCAMAQDPFTAAPGQYKLVFENPWVKVTRVTYKAKETAPMHNHPAYPTVYVYLTDAGAILFKHDEGFNMERRPVKAGDIRFNRGMMERHSVENLAEMPSEWLRVELKTQPADLPSRDVRLAAGENKPFENGQIRISRETCSPGYICALSVAPAVAISLTDGSVKWIPPGSSSFKNESAAQVNLVVIGFKTNPL